MTNALDEVVKIVTTITGRAPELQDFSKVLVYGKGVTYSDGAAFKEYSSAGDLLADTTLSVDGSAIDANSALYKCGASLAKLGGFCVGARTSSGSGATNQTFTLSIKDAANLTAIPYTLTITDENDDATDVTWQKFDTDGTTVLAPTASELLAGLKTEIEKAPIASNFAVTTTASDIVLTMNLNSYTLKSVTSNSFDSSSVAPVSGASIEADLINILNEIDFFGLLTISKDDADILSIARWAEAETKLFGVSVDDADVYDSGNTGNIAVSLDDRFNNTFLMYSSESDSFPEAKLFAELLPTPPGRDAWSYTEISDIGPEKLSNIQFKTLRDRKVNVFKSIAKTTVFDEGVNTKGVPIEEIVGRAWADNYTKVKVFEFLKTKGLRKVYTPAGWGLLTSVLDKVSSELLRYVYETIQFNLPNLADVTSQDKDKGIAPIEWLGTLQRTYRKVTINQIIQR